MSAQAAATLLSRVIEARGRLLRVERVPAPEADGGPRASMLLRLVFDVGIVELRPGRADGEIAARAPHPNDPPDDALLPADEEEPWWALLGQPLARAEALPAAGDEPAALGLQVRPDAERPRRLRIFGWGGAVHIGSWA